MLLIYHKLFVALVDDKQDFVIKANNNKTV